MSESAEQASIIYWFRMQYPKLHLIALPNGQWIAGEGKRKYALIAKYKREGWSPGVSDLFLAHSDGQNHGLWLEMKDKGKTQCSLSKEQKQWIEDMNNAGYIAKWAAGFEEAKAIITNYVNGYYRF